MRKKCIIILSILFLLGTKSINAQTDFFENQNKDGRVTLMRLMNVGGIWTGHGIKPYVNFNLTYYASGLFVSSEINYRGNDKNRTFSEWRFTPISLDVNLLHNKDSTPALMLGTDASFTKNQIRNSNIFILTPHIAVDAFLGTLKIGYDYDFKHRMSDFSISLTISPSAFITLMSMIDRV